MLGCVRLPTATTVRRGRDRSLSEFLKKPSWLQICVLCNCQMSVFTVWRRLCGDVYGSPATDVRHMPNAGHGPWYTETLHIPIPSSKELFLTPGQITYKPAMTLHQGGLDRSRGDVQAWGSWHSQERWWFRWVCKDFPDPSVLLSLRHVLADSYTPAEDVAVNSSLNSVPHSSRFQDSSGFLSQSYWTLHLMKKDTKAVGN